MFPAQFLGSMRVEPRSQSHPPYTSSHHARLHTTHAFTPYTSPCLHTIHANASPAHTCPPHETCVNVPLQAWTGPKQAALLAHTSLDSTSTYTPVHPVHHVPCVHHVHHLHHDITCGVCMTVLCITCIMCRHMCYAHHLHHAHHVHHMHQKRIMCSKARTRAHACRARLLQSAYVTGPEPLLMGVSSGPGEVAVRAPEEGDLKGLRGVAWQSR